jgi:hypothetical protein
VINGRPALPALAVPAYDAHDAGMRPKRAQYTLRDVSPAVDRALRKRAKEARRSLNSVALEALAAGAGVSAEPPRYHDLDGFFGSWVEDPAVERALRAQREIDEDLWK